MKTKIAKWGNSYGVRIPKDILTNLELHENEAVYVFEKKGQIVIQKSSNATELTKLLKDVKPQKEFSWGEKAQNEFW